LQGPINVAAPNPVTNRDFTHTLGRVIDRFTAIPLPAFAARLVLGEMADELLLISQRMSVQRLVDSGFTFEYPELQSALEHLIASER
jgi:NAD dependent epimerase/dehydratase family enzyme